jgi:SAM-dependent methyltransferase
MAACLRSGTTGSLRAAAITFSMEPFWRPYDRIMHSLMTGEPAFDQVYGMNVYAYMREHPEEMKLFAEAAKGAYAQSTGPVVAAYDFSRCTRVVDVGGGSGYVLAAILAAHPHLRGVLFERPAVLENARSFLRAEGIDRRIELVAGDFFESVPAGGDLYLTKSCLHNFDDDRAISMLRVIRRAIPDDAPLLVVDSVVPPGNEPHYSKLDDVEMLVIAGGIDRREDEWSALLAAGGFKLARVIPTSAMVSILEARPV